MTRRRLLILLAFGFGATAALQAQGAGVRADTIDIHLIDVDVRTAVQALAQYLDRPVVVGGIGASKVTLATPRPIRSLDILPLLKATLESQNLEIISDSGGPYRVRMKQPPVPAPDAAGLQRAARVGEARLYVIRLSHARAADVAATVNALYGKASAFGELGSRTPTLSQQLTQNQQSSYSAMTAQPATNGAAILNRPATLTGETTIVPDASTNALIIRASPGDYELIAAAVKELDVRPLQALIEVLVAEVRRDRALEFGVDVSLPSLRLPGHPATSYSGYQRGLPSGDAVLRVVGIGGDSDLEATIRAAASRGDVTIVSRPTVLAANNEQAQILVGSQRPFVQVSRALPTDGGTRDRVVQYRDVGTKLSVRPTISADGYVMLEVSQEVSAATSETQFDAPVISTRSVQTRLLLKDGQTVVIGGLTDRQRDVTQSGVPILSSIPFVGGLFGRAARHTSETELFLFITPRVIRTDADAAELTAPAEKRANVKR